MNVAAHPLYGLSLCSGIGGLELGLRLALGERYRCAVYVEREAYAAAILAARMEEGALDQGLIWDDLATLDGKAWRGIIQIISAGLPCQPWSVAGKRLGHDDERAIWPDFIRIVSEVRPAVVFLENVPPFVTQGYFRRIGEELSGLGYEIEDPLFIAAASVGASHRRERVFILARLADANGEGLEKRGGVAGDGGEEHTPTERVCFDLPIFAPGPADPRWADIIERHPGLAPATQPTVRVLADGPSCRVDELRAIGNAVVPLCAAVAFRTLTSADW